MENKATGKDVMLILCGDRGPGKTQIATYWASKVNSPRYFRAHDLMEAIRGKFSSLKELENESFQTLNKAKRCCFLVLDEFSELAGTEYERKTLTNLIDYRYGEKLTTIIITNANPEQAPDEVGRSIWSRAEEVGGIVECNWGSYRKH